MQEYKIFSYIDDITDAYKEPVSILEGLTFDHKDTLKTIEFYCNNKFLSGNRDGLGREKPFYNVGNYRVTTAKTATDLDVKDIRFEPDSLSYATQAMLYNKELFNYLKEINFSETLNDMGKTRPKYGGLLIKKYDDGEGMEIEVVEWKNTEVDPTDILGGTIIETHFMNPSEVLKKSDVWENVDELIKAHAKANKNKPVKVEIKEVTGEFSYSFDPDIKASDENDKKFKSMCFYVGVVNNKKFFLYKEDLKENEDKYKYLAWEKVPGRGLGRGIVEEGFESQVWVNDSMISMKNAMDLSGKVLLSTTSKKVSGNAITGVDTGHIFELEPNTTISSLNLSPSALPQFENTINLWNDQYNKIASTFDANTGEAPTAGTPYSQTALLNQVANSPFEYQREVWGIFLNEVLNDWIKPELKKRIKKAHNLVSDFTDEELDLIDESIAAVDVNRATVEAVINEQEVTPEDQMAMGEGIKQDLAKKGKKREIEIPEKYLDVEGKITANITGELKNKAAILQSLDSVFKTVASTFNPNTGKYAALEDPTLSKVFGMIVEMSGIPFSSTQLKSSKASGQPSPVGSQAPTAPDLSAITPQPAAQTI